jgi:cysteine-rich repeat protein
VRRLELLLGITVCVGALDACSTDDPYGDDAGWVDAGWGDGGKGGGGTTGNGGTVTGGAGGLVSNDGCPGRPLAPALDGPAVTDDASLGDLADDVHPYCVPPDRAAPDAVYRIEVTEAGTLDVQVVADAIASSALYVTRGTCDAIESAVFCESTADPTPLPDAGLPEAGLPEAGAPDATFDASVGDGGDASSDAGTRDASSGGATDASRTTDAASDGASRDAARDVEAESSKPGAGTTLLNRAMLAVTRGTYYAVVDGEGGGLYSVSVQLRTGACGDGAVNEKEDCDYRDTLDGDGCSSTCEFEPPAGGDACGVDVRGLVFGELPVIDGHTIGYGDQYAPQGKPCQDVPGGAPDRVYGFYSATPGVLDLTVEADFDAVLYAMASCEKGNLSGRLGCSDGERRTAAEHLRIPIPSNTTHHVVVDGFGPRAYGKFTLRVLFEE